MLAWMRVGLAVLLVLPCACSKSGQADKVPPMQIEGVNVDIPKLTAEFVNAPPEISSRVTDGVSRLRLRRYDQCLSILDEVLNKPGLNDKQKKLLTQVTGQLKEVVAKTEAH
jgi:hypothetical protein